ncbi:MAG: class F sortase [Candidatus Nealsonbacteria bacterium DGGOD1a]|nr:MAG: class F sortase [Candidatus Nealsonbacteria bacterium DGGOD1a]
MRLKILSKRAMLTVALFSGSVLFAAILLPHTPKNLIHDGSASLIENAAILSNEEPASVELPARLKIPTIDVDSAVIPMGLTSDGAMDVPKSPTEVAWFDLGLRPGENGAAVIAGHYGWKNNTPGVFDNLYKLAVGDKIFVEDEKGSTAAFVVREVKIYGKDEAVPDAFVSSDGKAHLNLVTCAGAWDKAEKTRFERLIVFTDKE